jgi:HSP90 family molecular chaperone
MARRNTCDRAGNITKDNGEEYEKFIKDFGEKIKEYVHNIDSGIKKYIDKVTLYSIICNLDKPQVAEYFKFTGDMEYYTVRPGYIVFGGTE